VGLCRKKKTSKTPQNPQDFLSVVKDGRGRAKGALPRRHLLLPQGPETEQKGGGEKTYTGASRDFLAASSKRVLGGKKGKKQRVKLEGGKKEKNARWSAKKSKGVGKKGENKEKMFGRFATRSGPGKKRLGKCSVSRGNPSLYEGGQKKKSTFGAKKKKNRKEKEIRWGTRSPWGAAKK